MANLTMNQHDLSMSHIKHMSEESPATVPMALTLAYTTGMTSSVYVFRVVHAMLTSLALSVNALHLYGALSISAFISNHQTGRLVVDKYL